MAEKYILYKKTRSTDTFGVIKFYCDKVQLFPTYHNYKNIWLVVEGDSNIFVFDTDRESWAFCKIDTSNADLVRPVDFAYEKYVINFESAAVNAKPTTISKNADYNKTNVQIFSTPINVNSAANHAEINDIHALYVLGSTYIGSDLQPSEISTDNYDTVKGALVVGSGGALIRKNTHIGGALIVDGVVWESSSDVWSNHGNVASEFKYQLHITGTDNVTAINTGALQVLGGVFIAKNTLISGSLSVAGISTTSLSASGIIQVTNQTNSTDTATGSFITAGGVAIAKSAYIGADLTVIGSLTAGSLTVQSGINITGDLSLDNVLTKHDVTFNHNLIFGTSTVGIIFKGNTTYAAQPTMMCDTTDTLYIQSVASNGITMLNAIKIKSLVDQPIVTFDSTTDAVSATVAATIFKGGVYIAKKLISSSISLFSTDATSLSTSGGIQASKDIVSLATISGANVKANDGVEVYDLAEAFNFGLRSITNKPILSVYSASASNTIVISAGAVVDDTNKVVFGLNTPINKVLSSTWVVGSGNGMLLSSLSLAADMTYKIYLIYNKTTKVVDALAVAYNVTNVVLPTGFGYKKYIGSIITDSSSNIISFIQLNNKFVIEPKVEFSNARSSTPTYVDIQRVARGIKAEAILLFKGSTTLNTTDKTIFYAANPANPSSPILVREIELSPTASNGVESSEYEVVVPVENNTDYSRINLINQNSIGSLVLKTRGWIDYDL